MALSRVMTPQRSCVTSAALMIGALVGLLVCCSASQSSQLEDYCAYTSNANSDACTANATACQPIDGWWSDPSVCTIPGRNPSALAFPANTNYWDTVAGGQEYLLEGSLVDTTDRRGGELGRYWVWRSYTDVLYFTVALGGRTGKGQPLLQNPSSALSQSQTIFGIALLPKFDPIMPVAYTYFNMPEAGLYSCFTVAINLASVCNAHTSVYSGASSINPSGCRCRDWSSNNTACPPQDLRNASDLFFSVSTTAVLFNTSADGCGEPTGRTVTLADPYGINVYRSPDYDTTPLAPPPPPSPPAPPPPYPPPAPPPTPPPPPAPPSPTPPPSPPNWNIWVAVNLTSTQRLLSADADCALTQTMLSPYYAFANDFLGTRCSVTTQDGPTINVTTAEGFSNAVFSTGENAPFVSSLVFTVFYATNNTALSLFHQTMQLGFLWANMARRLELGCGLYGSYIDTVGNAAFDVCNYEGQSDACLHIIAGQTWVCSVILFSVFSFLFWEPAQRPTSR
ncbi:hypothetical protein FOA52_010520 [Chlamydomonas sp. UWO 241]|nr:hypothetical protein FOA52_010520 [Chlamydomonas sp. UWO 241]